MVRKNNFKSAGAIVLGMHDALVSLTGLISGLAIAMADRYAIILTAIIASITASLSMGASNYLAVRAGGGRRAFISALYTGGAYMATCALLILPFFIFSNRALEMIVMFVIAVAEIFGFNYYLGCVNQQPYMRSFFEMLGVCVCVSIVAFLIGLCAQYRMNVTI